MCCGCLVAYRTCGLVQGGAQTSATVGLRGPSRQSLQAQEDHGGLDWKRCWSQCALSAARPPPSGNGPIHEPEVRRFRRSSALRRVRIRGLRHLPGTRPGLAGRYWRCVVVRSNIRAHRARDQPKNWNHWMPRFRCPRVHPQEDRVFIPSGYWVKP